MPDLTKFDTETALDLARDQPQGERGGGSPGGAASMLIITCFIIRARTVYTERFSCERETCVHHRSKIKIILMCVAVLCEMIFGDDT